jgi:membrane protease YdiL (CAAX protease family)
MTDPYDAGPGPWDYPHPEPPPESIAPGDVSGAAADPAQPAAPPEFVECWRCGKLGFRDAEICLYCRARLSRHAAPRRADGDGAEGALPNPTVKVIALFIAFLATSVLFGVLIRFGFDPKQFQGHREARQLLYWELAVEVVDTLLVVLGLVWVGRLARSRPSPAARVAGWAMAGPVLVLLLALNFAYFHFLKDILRLPTMEEELAAHKDLLWLVILVMCVQPAVVEELFFRYLALGALRDVTTVGGAVVISSVMFGMAHIFNPIGIPYLVVAGMVFGWVRVASGSIVLPMAMHFLHNLAVLFLL